jgi:hypothetical protein
MPSEDICEGPMAIARQKFWAVFGAQIDDFRAQNRPVLAFFGQTAKKSQTAVAQKYDRSGTSQ